jgi:hypothetical protein
MKCSTFKGLYHGALTVAALCEARTSRTKTRSLLLGGCAGWHLWATFYHFFIEEKEQECHDRT